MRTVMLLSMVVVTSACPGGGGPGPTGGGSGGGLNLGGFGGSSGGGQSSAGGSAGGAVQAGGSAGGTSTAGGTAGAMGGAVTVSEFLYDPKVVATADGTFHVTHRTNSAVVYGRCSASCEQRSSWQFVNVESAAGFVADTRIAAEDSGRIHLVYNATSPSDRNVYATCAANCLVASNWTKTDLPSPSECTSEDNNNNLVLDSTGRLTFLSSDGNTERLCVNTCAGTCGTPSNWQTGVILNIRVSGRRIQTGFAGSGTTLHLVYDDLTAGLRYASCSANCTQGASWQISNPLFFHVDTPIALAAAPNGRLVLAYNQGTTDASAPANVKAQDNKLLAVECLGSCGERASWDGVVLGDGEGSRGVGAVALPSGIAVAAAQVGGTRAYACASGCGQATSWEGAELDTQAALLAALPDPFSVLGCTANGQPVRPANAFWAPQNPTIAISSLGALVHTMTGGLRMCPGLSTSAAFPGYGRLLFSPP